MNIDKTQIVTKEQRDASQATAAREKALAKRAAKYKELTDPLLLEIIRKRFADDPDFAEVNTLVEQIHEEILIPGLTP